MVSERLNLAEYLCLRGRPPRPLWPPPPRAPLPPWPAPRLTQPSGPEASCWTYSATPTDLAVVPPPQPSLDFHRGNFCGLRVPGLPPVPGGAADPSVFMTWFLYEYSDQWQDRSLDTYQGAGHTHIDFHRAAWMGRLEGVPGCSKDVALDQVRKCVDRGLYVIVNLAIDPGPQDPNEIIPWIDDLVDAGMQIGCLGWQIDQLIRQPGEYCQYVNWCGPYLHSKGVKVSAHYLDDACAWWNAPDDHRQPNSCEEFGVCNRFDFQRWTADKIDFPYMQVGTEAPIYDDRPFMGGLRVSIKEVLRSLVTQKLVIAEYDAQAEFDDGQHRLELYGDQKGRWLMATSYHGRGVEGGYLNGARRTDGSAL